MMYSISNLLAFFMFYAVVGWCIEVIYKTTNTGKFVNRGFLNGPLCPIYGAGATIVIVCLTPLQDNLLLLFVGSVILTSALEYITGLILEKIFHQKWWDYSGEHFNIKGYICLKFSLAWGLACVFVMKVIQPFVLLVCDKTPVILRDVIFIIFYGLMVADIGITVAALAKITLQLKLANDLDRALNHVSERIGVPISNRTLKGMEEIEEGKEKLAELKAAARERELAEKEKLAGLHEKASLRVKAIEERYSTFVEKSREKCGEKFSGTERLSFVHRRLEKAFPILDLKRITYESMSAKLKSVKSRLEEIREDIRSRRS